MGSRSGADRYSPDLHRRTAAGRHTIWDRPFGGELRRKSASITVRGFLFPGTARSYRAAPFAPGFAGDAISRGLLRGFRSLPFGAVLCRLACGKEDPQDRLLAGDAPAARPGFRA